jgi:predicted enzyme related to lactoylglutathione lyase
MSTSVETHVGQIVWHDLMTTDVERAKAFYGEFLGWEFEVWQPGEFEYSMITSGDRQHGGFRELDEASGAPPHWLAYVRVEDADAAAEQAAQAGGTVYVQPTDIPDVGRFSVLADPQGAVLAAFAPAEEMALPQGVFAWDELVTTDVEGAKAFYAAVLGWGSREWEGEAPYTLFTNPAKQEVAGVMDRPANYEGPPSWLTYLLADDLEARVAKARELGAEVYLEGMDLPDIGRIAVLADPTGAAFGLFKPAES